MTDTVATPEAEPTEEVSVSAWEDMIDIFYSPATVFARRGDGRLALPLITLMVLTGIFTFISISVLAPLYEAESARQIMKLIEANPDLDPEQLPGVGGFNPIFMVSGAVISIPVIAVILGLLVRLVGVLFDAALTIRLSIMIVVLAYFPRMLQQLLNIIQGYIMEPESLTYRFAIGFSPARFMDFESASPLILALAERFDIFTLWVTLIIAVGYRVTGKVSAGNAFLAAALVWALGSIPTVVPALMG